MKEGRKEKGGEGAFSKEATLKSGNKALIKFGFWWDGDMITRVYSGTVTTVAGEVARFSQERSSATWHVIEKHLEDEVRKLVSDCYDDVKDYFSKENEEAVVNED